MNEQTTNTNGTTNANTQPEDNGVQAENGKLFTQEEVNRIVSERLNRERAKAEPSEQEKREGDLSARENKIACREYLFEKGDSKDLLDIVETNDIDKFKKNVDKLAELFPAINANTPRFTSRISGNPLNNDEFAEAFKPKY